MLFSTGGERVNLGKRVSCWGVCLEPYEHVNIQGPAVLQEAMFVFKHAATSH